MKKHLLTYSLFSLIFFLISTTNVKAQTDVTVFDYDSYTGCDACGDKIMYNVNGTKDSLTDATPSTHYLSVLRVKVKLFTCYNGNLNLTLNGNVVATVASPVNCACNACDSLTFDLTSAQIRNFYKYGQKNVFRLMATSGGLYIDRTIITRTRTFKSNYDAGIMSVDSPSLYVCAGTKNIKIKINNNGKKPFTGVGIDWKWNGVSQTGTSHSGTLDTVNGSGNNTAVVTLGAKTFSKGKRDTLMAWTKNPGGITDSSTFNDTIRYIFNGSYGDTIRIGGSSPHFGTIQAAVNSLMTNGVCATTYVKIWPGTYNEQVTIGPIPGAGSSSPIIFLSKNNDSSSVVINYSANSSANYTAKLSNTSYIIFQKVTIEALSSSYGTAVSMMNNVENIGFINCALIGPSTTSTSTNMAVVQRTSASASDKTNNLFFNQTRFNDGSYGMFLNNSSSTYLNGLNVRNCLFENQYYSNLTCNYSRNVGINNNTFDRNSSSYYYGSGLMFQNTSDSLNISSNRVLQRNCGYGIYLSSCIGKSSKRNLIANNFISTAFPYTYGYDHGLSIYYNDYTDVVNNSIYRNSANTGFAGLYVEQGTNNRIFYNNVFNANAGTALNMYSSSNNSVQKSDRNNFYNNGNDLGTWYSNTVKNISDIISKIGQDTNSVSVNPNYTSSTNLHAYGVDLDGRARPYSGITKDIDGQTRNATTPDIGADEFNLKGLDIGVTAVMPVITGTNCLKVVLRNLGSTTVTSAKIDWKVNGAAKSQVSWSGSLAKGDTDIVCLGNVLFKRDTLYKLVAWSSAPNAGTDSLKTNDTLKADFYPAMNGIYTIGGSTPDFATFNLALTALEKAGIIDSVYFKVRNGTYTEQLKINNISKATHKNSVIFESESKDSSKVILQYNSSSSGNNYVVWLNGSDGITFRKMTLQNHSTSSYRNVIMINNGALYPRFENNVIQNSDSTSTNYSNSLVQMEYNQGADINFIQNIFNKGTYGLYLYGNSSSRDNGINIQKNIFKKQSYQPMYIRYMAKIEISNNTISTLSNNVYSGIELDYFTGVSSINNNKIYISGTNAYYGLYMYSYSSAVGDTFRVYNNFITIEGPNDGLGIYADNLAPANFYYNNVLNNCKDSASYSAAFYFYGGILRVYNNNFVHTGNGYVYSTDFVSSFKSDFNNLFSNGTKYIYWDGPSYTTMAAYRSATGRDAKSVETDPLYTSSSDLHTAFSGINGKGRLLNGITKDIDGETRNTSTPDIGADEFTPPTLDAGVSKLINPGDLFKTGTLNVEVVVTNYGIDTIKNFMIQVKVNKDTLVRKKITRTIKSGDTVHVKLGNYLFKSDSSYNFIAYTFLPNGATDQKKSNDTLKVLGRLPAMTGVYTIGGTTPNFPTFKAALNALKKAGIADSVRFRVRAGTYTEQLNIPPISGAGARNSIIFESQNGDSTSVILQYNSAYYDTNYVVQFNGADGITFRYMTIKSTASSYSVIFNIKGRAINNTIYRNIIQNTSTSTSSEYNALIYSSTDADDNLHIKNNIFKNGSYAIYLYGYPSNSPYTYEKGLEITNNRIQNTYYRGIYVVYNDSADISGNYLTMYSYTYAYGFYFENLTTNFKVNNNKLHMPNANLGIYFYECGSSFRRNLVSNNSIYLKNSSTNPYGIYTYYCYYTDIIHNSVNIESPYTSSYSLQMYYGSNNNLYNNILSNNLGYAVYISSSSSITNSNNNNFISKGSNLGYWNGSTTNDLTAWQSASSQDANSLSVDPIFKSVSDLHIKEVSLNGAAKYFKSVPLDFEGQTRDTLKPDIGADEFQLPPNDAGISKILVPNKPFASDTQQVKIVLKNYGGNPLYVADINWKFNGVSQTAVSWSGTLQAGDTMHVKLGKKFFHPDSGYSVIAWTKNPNGTGDSIPANDTAKILNQYPALSGIYTIGGASPDFATFNDAVTAMKRGGIIDSVRFDVRSGTYYEQIKIPYIVGANSENDIIFQSEVKDSSKVFLISTNTSTNNFTVRLDSTNGVTFRYMSFGTTFGYYYNRLFEILQAAKNINIHDCNLTGWVTTTGNSEALIYIYNGNSNLPAYDNIEICKNRMTRGSEAVYVYGYSSTGSGYGKNLDIHHNNMEDQYYMGIQMNYNSNYKINSNAIYHTSTAGYGSGYGIYSEYSNDGFELMNNNIYNQEYCGVYMNQNYGKASDTSLFANNFIHCRTNNGVYGLQLYSSDYLNFVNNNINITSTNAASSYAAYISSPSRTVCFNNNFVTMGTGFAIYLSGNFTKCDNNNFYTTGSVLGYYNSANRANLAAWRTATAKDAKSLSVNPDYVSSTDLHVRGTDLNAAGRNHKYLIKTDIDGQKRDTIAGPDIGADEFNIPAGKDAGILAYVEPIAPFASGSRSVKVTIKNFGSDSLKSATVKWKVNGTLQSNYSWTGALKTGQTQTITIGNYNFPSGIKHDMVFWTTSPNGGNDTTNYNDTAFKTNIYAALDGVYTVGGIVPDFATLTEAFTALKLGGSVDSVWFKMREGTYSHNLLVESYPEPHPSRPIYIESETGDSSDVVITNVGGNYSTQIMHINGADYLKFKKVTFRPVSYYGQSAVRYDNISKGLSFENCNFDLSNAYTYYYYTAYGIVSNSDKDDSLTVKNCSFDKGSYGIYCYSNSGNEKGINISNNVFTNHNGSGILMQYADAPKIRYNIINNSISSGTAISLNNTGLDLIVSHNSIHFSQAGGNGIYVYQHSGTSGSKANIFNNFIAINGSSGNEEGLYIYSSSYVNIFYNSINVYGTNTTSYALNLQYGNNFDIRNNVYTNMGGGYAVGYLNSPTIAQANYNDIYSTGTNLGNYNGANQTTLTAWKSASGKDANSLSLNPTYNSDYDLHTNLSSLDSACNPISGITDDIDLEARNTSKPDIGADEFQSLPENLGVTAFITPVNSCNLDSSFIKVKIFNFGNKAKVGFPVRYRIDGGSITTGTVTDTIKPGKEVLFQFATKKAFSTNTTYILQAWTDLSGEKYRANDSFKVTFIDYQKPDSVKNMVPADGTTGLDFPFTLSWAPSTGATRYDVYVWPFSTSRPSTPSLANTTQISYQITGSLTYGGKYNWQVEAKNPICSTPGKVQTFTMKHLPDLIVEEVIAPNTAFSSNTISVSWKIKNAGQGAASGTWYDAVYLSTDAVLDVTDLYLGAFVNPSALNGSQNYTQSASVNLPNGISGNYYVFVRTDQYYYINESDKGNNTARDTGKTVISLTPPPDLIVTTVTRPSTAFSGSSVSMTYVIKNSGTGATRSGSWNDAIFISTEKALNSASVLLRTNNHNGNLNVDSSYSVTTSVTIPNYISGKYFFVVNTDYNNYEYEHASEGNNTKGSDTMKIILTPPPDLIIKNLISVDTASNSESVLVKYNSINNGGTSTINDFSEAIYLCPTSTFNASASTIIGSVYHFALASKDTAKVSQNFTISKTLNGSYYIFVVGDYYNQINEVTEEGNNVSTGHKIIIRSPDLRVSRVTVRSSDTTGDLSPINWTVKNHGPGGDYQGNRTDSIYISTSATWNRNNSTPVGSLRYSATFQLNDTLPKSANIRIPDGFSGNRYFYVVTDAAKEVFEPTKDTNNYKRSNLMNIILAPYPDLLPSFLSFPDSAKAGALIGLGYRVKNNSKKGNPVSSSHWSSAKANPNWKDRLYFSKDSVFNPTKVFLLVENTWTSALDTQGKYEKTSYMTLPASMARGDYYYFIYTDADKEVYEYTKDTNNIKRTKKIFIDGYPPVDLKVNCPFIADTMWSGNNYTLNYSVKNIGQAKTAVGSWNDAAYLSTDSILNSGDLLVATISITKALDKDSTYYVSQPINIPNGMSGNFYLLVKTDVSKLITDTDSTNNIKAACKTSGGAKKLRINLTDPPDLRITSWDIPSTGTSGQLLKIKWKVENKTSGSTAGGPTRSGSWMDHFYLSTDYTIDNSDYPLGGKRHTGNLAVNGSYNDSNEFTIPIDKVGNYIVIIKTDGANAEYEHLNEGNNVVSSVTNFTKAPPADLIVSQVTSPDSVLSGKTINVTWKVKNKGSNPATGSMTDNIYLSIDNKQDASDLLLYSENNYVSIAPNTESSHNKTLSVSGVSIGNYYVLITTDVLNNINESNDTNNTSTAVNQLNVNVPILPIAVKTKDTLSNGEKIYYRIEIPSNYVGESMLITLKADSVKGNNEIFVRHGAMVSGSEFDYKYREPFKGNQEIIIPELKAGTYYLMTTGQKTGAPTWQPIILFARIMPFEIRKVTPAIGGNTGEVTVMVEGSKFEPGTLFMLLKNGITYSGQIDTLNPNNEYQYSGNGSSSGTLIDPTTAFATFNLTGMDTGKYDVIALKGLESAVLLKGFKVIEGVAGDLLVEIESPANTRANTVLSMNVLFRNTGNTDIVGKKLIVSSTSGAPIGLTEGDLSKNLSTVEITVQEPDGPPNRLRPDGNGSVRIYMKSTGALGFTILNN